MGLKIGICGAAQCSSSVIPLFQAHPAVDEVVIAEVFPERRAKMAELFRIARTFTSHEELLRSDVDAVVILTQRWTHARPALRAGKHGWSAVPAGITVRRSRS
jgi:predicted dehydrogenase